MFTWISRALASAALMALAGCETGIDVGLGAGGRAFVRAAPETVAVADDTVIVAGPPGYCVDPSAVRDSGAGAFVLLGSCASISRDAGKPRPEMPGLLTVSVSPQVNPSVDAAQMLEALSAHVRTPEGRAVLSRSGDPEAVEILETQMSNGVLYIRARDRGRGLTNALEDDYWRALLAVRDRLITASVVGFSRQPMSRSDGLSIVDAFAERLLRENAGQAPQ